MKWWRGVLLAGSLLFIATATLTPGKTGGVSEIRTDFWCLACGTEGGADVTLNIALFVPLGAALALLRISPLRAFAIGMLLSVSVEVAQRLGIPPGRVASLTDLLTNSTGTLLGAYIAWNHRSWLRPAPRAATAFATASVSAVMIFLGFTGWALGRDAEQPARVGQAALIENRGASVSGYGWYHGLVSRATVSEHVFLHEGDGPVVLLGSAADEVRGDVEIDGRDERREFVPFLSLRGTHPRVPELMVGQRNHDAQLHVRLRGTRLRFPGPSLVLANAFAVPGDVRHTLRYTTTPKLWMLSSTTGGTTISVTLPLSLSLGWTLFQTVVHVGDRVASVVTLLWLFALWLPVGYWCRMAGQPASDLAERQRSGNIQRWRFVTAGVAAVCLTLWLVPRAVGIADSLPQEWVLSMMGFAAGVFFATRFYNHIPSQ